MSAPIFTKRHYRIIAAAVHAALEHVAGDVDYKRAAHFRVGAQLAAAVLNGTNPRFDSARFVEACLDGCDTARSTTTHRSPIR